MANDSIKDRLKALAEGREVAGTPPPLTGRESHAQLKELPGYEGRAARTRALRDKVRTMSPYEAAGAPFENLLFTNSLIVQGEKEDMGWLRAEAGFRFRQDVQMAQVSTLGAKDFGGVGGGSGSRSTLADVKIYAMQSLGRLKDAMPKGRYQLLEAFLINDQWLLELPRRRKKMTKHERRAAEKKHRDEMLDQVLCALDTAAVHYDLLRYPTFRERWPGARYGRVRSEE